MGQSLSDEIVDIALSNLQIINDPLPNSIHSFAEQADELGYLGRNGYDISEIFYNMIQIQFGGVDIDDKT